MRARREGWEGEGEVWGHGQQPPSKRDFCLRPACMCMRIRSMRAGLM